MREFIPSQLISAGASSRRPLPATDTPLGTPRWCGWTRATRRCRTFLPAGSSMSSGVKRRVCRAPIDIVPKFLVRTLTKRWSSRMSPSSSSPNTYAPAFGSFRQNLAVRPTVGNKRPVVRPVASTVSSRREAVAVRPHEADFAVAPRRGPRVPGSARKCRRPGAAPTPTSDPRHEGMEGPQIRVA